MRQIDKIHELERAKRQLEDCAKGEAGDAQHQASHSEEDDGAAAGAVDGAWTSTTIR